MMWVVVVTGVSALGWALHPEGGSVDVSAFKDGGASLCPEVPSTERVPFPTRMRAAVAIRFLPVLGGALLAGIATGLFLRQRMRYASPALSWIGKRVAATGVALAILFVSAPFDWASWVPYGAAIAIAFGALVYTSNLPARL